MRKAQRKKIARKRKNFFPILLAIACSWTLLASVIYFVDPGTTGAIAFFFLVLFISFFFTFSALLVNSLRGFILSLAISLFLVLRYLGIGNVLNLLLIVGLTITTDIYFQRKGN